MDQEVPHVGHLEETNRMTCLVDDICFEAPVGYVKLGKFNIYINQILKEDIEYAFYLRLYYVIIYLAGAEVRTQFMEEEDDLLQFAIQQSLLEVGSERDEVQMSKASYISPKRFILK